jgi:hypothetical protein
MAARLAAGGGKLPTLQQSSQPKQTDAGRRTNACSRRLNRGHFPLCSHINAALLGNPFANPPRLMLTVRRRIGVSSFPLGRLRLSGRMLVGVDAHRSQDLQPYAGRSQEHGVDAHPGRRSGRSVPAANT